jgi:ankyrin repeat protein
MGNSTSQQTKNRTLDTLWIAIASDDWKTAQQLVSISEGVDYYDSSTQQCVTRFALEKRCPVTLFELLIKQKPIITPDSKGYTLCHYAAQFNLTSYLSIMLSNGVPARPFTKDNKLEPLDYASQSGADYNVLKLLIDHGARANHMTPLGTPLHLHLASGKSTPEIIRLLVKDGFGDVNASFDGHTPLLLATKNGLNLDIIKELVNLGSDINASTNGLVSFLGMTPLSYAKKNCTQEVVKFLSNPPQPTVKVAIPTTTTNPPNSSTTTTTNPPLPPPSRTISSPLLVSSSSNIGTITTPPLPATVQALKQQQQTNDQQPQQQQQQRRPSQNVEVLKARLSEKDEELMKLRAEAEENRQRVAQLTAKAAEEERKRILAEERLQSFSVASEVASNYQGEILSTDSHTSISLDNNTTKLLPTSDDNTPVITSSNMDGRTYQDSVQPLSLGDT